MSFLPEFNENIYVPWSIEYVAFESIYIALHGNCGSEKWTSQDEEDFESVFRLEAGKVDLFINRKQREIESRVAYCERALSHKENMSDSAKNLIDDSLTDILADLNELSRFTRINFKALENLIQEHDELAHTNLRSLFVDVCRTRPLDNQRFDKMLVQVSSLIDICRKRLEPPTQSATTHNAQQPLSAKYWVHQDNVTEVKAILLFNLPMFTDDNEEEFEQTERTTSTIYFDNDKFSQYLARLQNDDGEDIINCRWYGDIENSKKVSIERKVFVKSDKEKQFTHGRIELEQNQVADFISQRYSAEEYAEDLKPNPASDQTYVNSCYTIAQSIQKSIVEKQLEPKLRVYFNRLRFKLPQEHTLCVTLDSDVAFAKEGGFRKNWKEWRRKDMDIDYPFKRVVPQDDLHLFPYSILEMQIPADGQLPIWLSRLLGSKLVYEVPRFSTYLHGISQFWRPMLPLLPWWLPRMEIDIRNEKHNGIMNFTGLTRSNSLRPLIDGHYRIGYLESQLGKKEDHKRHSSSSINSNKANNIGNQMNNNNNYINNVNLLVSDNQHNTERGLPAHGSIDQSSLVSQQSIANSSSIHSKTRLRSRYPPEGSNTAQHNSNFIKAYYDGRNDQSQAYMLQDVNTVKESDAIRKSAIIEMEEVAPAKKKKEKKRKPRSHTMEPKQFFANERTFIHWLQFSAIILTAALTLLNFGDKISTISGATFFGISLTLALYAFFRYRYRAHQMSTRPDIRYDDLYGPVGLCVLLVGAMIVS